MPRKRNLSTPTTSNPSSLTVPRRIEKAIRDLAKRAKVDPQQVLEDMCDHGIIQATAMYADLIECRANLQTLKGKPLIQVFAEEDESFTQRTPESEGEPELNGQSEDGFGFISRDVAPIAPELFDPGVEPGFDDAALGPGLEEEEPSPDHAHEGSASDHLLSMPVE